MPAVAANAPEPFALDAAWRLSPQVALRREAFGALAYHCGTRRLTFLKDPILVGVVRGLAHHDSARAACHAAGVNPARMGRFEHALAALERSGMLTQREPTAGPWRGHGDGAGGADGVVPNPVAGSLTDECQLGLRAPICLTWELTYACNLACAHCLSSSGRRDPRELRTTECEGIIDELQSLQVFYVNIGGGEPTVRPDFWHLVDYATGRGIGVKFSTNGSRITPDVAARLAARDYVDVQVSLDGATAAVNDAVRGPGSYDMALGAMRHLARAGFGPFKVSVVVTRHNVGQLDEFKAIADSFGAQLRITRLRPSGRGADVWDELHPTAEHQRQLYDWLLARGDDVLTGDSFFHLAGYGEALPGLNVCGAGRVVCLIDPIGDVYACPFAIHQSFLAGTVRAPGGFASVWRESELFATLRHPQTGGACAACERFDACRGGCVAAKFFTGLPLDGPDPECVRGFGVQALAERDRLARPRPSQDHSRPPSGARTLPVVGARQPRACDDGPLAEFDTPTVATGASRTQASAPTREGMRNGW